VFSGPNQNYDISTPFFKIQLIKQKGLEGGAPRGAWADGWGGGDWGGRGVMECCALLRLKSLDDLVANYQRIMNSQMHNV
jgi:hypothetical protein